VERACAQDFPYHQRLIFCIKPNKISYLLKQKSLKVHTEVHREARWCVLGDGGLWGDIGPGRISSRAALRI
jgi:hypothetical protein